MLWTAISIPVGESDLLPIQRPYSFLPVIECPFFFGQGSGVEFLSRGTKESLLVRITNTRAILVEGKLKCEAERAVRQTGPLPEADWGGHRSSYRTGQHTGSRSDTPVLVTLHLLVAGSRLFTRLLSGLCNFTTRVSSGIRAGNGSAQREADFVGAERVEEEICISQG